MGSALRALGLCRCCFRNSLSLLPHALFMQQHAEHACGLELFPLHGQGGIRLYWHRKAPYSGTCALRLFQPVLGRSVNIYSMRRASTSVTSEPSASCRSATVTVT